MAQSCQISRGKMVKLPDLHNRFQHISHPDIGGFLIVSTCVSHL